MIGYHGGSQKIKYKLKRGKNRQKSFIISTCNKLFKTWELKFKKVVFVYNYAKT